MLHRQWDQITLNDKVEKMATILLGCIRQSLVSRLSKEESDPSAQHW